MAIEYADKIKNKAVDGAAGGHAGATIKIYDSAKPSGAMTQVPTGINLANVVLNSPSHGPAVNKVAPLLGPIEQAAEVTGTALCFTIVDPDGTIIARGTISNNAGAGDMKLSSTSLVLGVGFQITAYPISHP